jgi:hypothetical protein
VRTIAFEIPGSFIPRYAKHIGLAADLTVFDVRLLCPGRGITGGFVPLSATFALEPSVIGSAVFR